MRKRNKSLIKAFSIIVAVLILVIGFSLLGGADDAPDLTPYEPDPCPFKAGERLEYEFGWNGIPAAKAVMTVTETKINDQTVYRLRTETFTTGKVRLLWKMDDWGESIVHPNTMKPITFFMHQDEAGVVADTIVQFDHDSKIANITRTSKRKTKKRDLQIIDAYDPLSLIYLLRCIKLKVGDKKVFEIVDGHHTYRVIFYVAAKEKISIGIGDYMAFRIEPNYVRVPPPDKPEEKMLHRADLWINVEKPNHLLQLKSKIMVGTVYGELLSISYPQ